MSDQNVSWEDRVVALELEAKQERERRAAAEKTVTERDASIVALKTTVAEFKAAADKRRADEIETYVGGLKAQAAPAAIEESKLASVQSLFAAGMDTEAKVLGAAILANAKSVATPAGKVLPLGSSAPSAKKVANQNTAEQLRAAGWTVELSADGEITKKTPPNRGGR